MELNGKNWYKPNDMIIDISPSEKNNSEQVIETALAFKLILDKPHAVSFCKTSGATSLHIYVLIGKKHLYEQVKDFAQFLCMLVNAQLPLFTICNVTWQNSATNIVTSNICKTGEGKLYPLPIVYFRIQVIHFIHCYCGKKLQLVCFPLLLTSAAYQKELKKPVIYVMYFTKPGRYK